ncbi:MAG: flippase-like domain-containing protein [Solirubrobacteraceae bacterium]|nr:flippase-like domain-containing protein [Solirubrobacteraceae bacterium]
MAATVPTVPPDPTPHARDAPSPDDPSNVERDVADHDDTTFAADFDPGAVKRSALRVLALIGILALVALLTPGLGELRERLGDADVGWLVLAVVLEGLSGLSYVLMLKPIFLRGRSWWDAQRLGWSELAMGSIMPSSGVAGLALGAWVLGRAGMEPRIIARRSVAFYIIKGSANFVAVAVIGLLMYLGVGPEVSPWLTLFPAVLAVLLIGVVAFIPRLGPGGHIPEDAGRVRRTVMVSRKTLVHAVREAGTLLRGGHPAVYVGALGYWFFDNAVIWATFKAFGEDPAITVVLMGYLLGQLGGLIPVPGGIGGVDGGLVGAFVIYGEPAGASFIAVLAYRVILFWLPLLIGAIAFLQIQRRMKDIERLRPLATDHGEGLESGAPAEAHLPLDAEPPGEPREPRTGERPGPS